MQFSKKKSGGCCSAIGCSKRKGTNLLSQVKMFYFPADPVRRAAWCSAIRRENWTPTKNSLLCNAHFIEGKPSYDPQHPDYVPSIFTFNEKANEDGLKKVERYQRNMKRSKSNSLVGNSSLSNVPSQLPDTPLDVSSSLLDASSSNVQSIGVQTEISLDDLENLDRKVRVLENENTNLRDKCMMTSTYDSVMNHSTKTLKFYTGLENNAVFNSLLLYILAVWQPKIKVALQPCEQLLLVLMKLRLGLLNHDLACRFQIGIGTVSTVFNSWLNVMSANLNCLVKWPSKKQLRRNVPECFKDVSLENMKCIIDCTEIFIEKPRNFKARAATYSNYKHHNTIKFLVGITPTGVFSFISKAWGGRVADRYLTINSGFLDLIEENDVILADRGFKIDDLLLEKKAKLFIPASTKNKTQLSAQEVKNSRKMSKVRVHVERAIRKMKTFKILESNLPISIIKKKNGDDLSNLDKMLIVIGALCNMGNPVIKS